MKNFISLGFAIFLVLCTAQSKENRIESYSYILDGRREKTAVFDKKGDIIIKDYLFDDGIIYHKNDSVCFYKGRRIHI